MVEVESVPSVRVFCIEFALVEAVDVAVALFAGAGTLLCIQIYQPPIIMMRIMTTQTSVEVFMKARIAWVEKNNMKIYSCPDMSSKRLSIAITCSDWRLHQDAVHYRHDRVCEASEGSPQERRCEAVHPRIFRRAQRAGGHSHQSELRRLESSFHSAERRQK